MKKTKDLFNKATNKLKGGSNKDKEKLVDKVDEKKEEELQPSESPRSPHDQHVEVTQEPLSPKSQQQKKGGIMGLLNKVTGHKEHKEALVHDNTQHVDEPVTSPLPSPKENTGKKNIVTQIFNKVTGHKDKPEKSPEPIVEPVHVEETVVSEPVLPEKEEKSPVKAEQTSGKTTLFGKVTNVFQKKDNKEEKSEIDSSESKDVPIVEDQPENLEEKKPEKSGKSSGKILGIVPNLFAKKESPKEAIVVPVTHEENPISQEPPKEENKEEKPEKSTKIFGFVPNVFAKKEKEPEVKQETSSIDLIDLSDDVKPQGEPKEDSKPKSSILGLGVAKDIFNKTTSTVSNVATSTTHTLTSGVTSVTDKTKETVTNVTDKTKEVVGNVTEKVVDVKNVIGDAVQDVSEKGIGDIKGIINTVTDKLDRILSGPKYDEEKFFGVINDIKGVIPAIQEAVNKVVKALAPEKVMLILLKLFKLIKEVPLDKLLEIPGKITEVAHEFIEAVQNKEYLPKSRFACLTPIIQKQVNGDLVKRELEGFLTKFEDVGKALFAGIPFELINDVVDFIKKFSEGVIDACCESFAKLINIVKDAEQDIADILKAVNIIHALQSAPRSIEEANSKVREISSDMKNALVNTKNTLKNFGKTALELTNFQKFDFSPLKKIFGEIAGISKAFSKEKIENCITKIKDVVFFVMKASDELAKILALAGNGCLLIICRCLIEWPSFLEKAYLLILSFGEIVDFDELKGIFDDLIHLFTENELFNTDYNELVSENLNVVFDKVKSLLSNFNIVTDQVKGLVKLVKMK